MSLFSSLATAARKRVEYRRLAAELNGLSQREKADLNLDGGRAFEIARAAVYG